jgi:hypothetical protein
MKTRFVLFSIALLLSLTCLSQNQSAIKQRINILGLGYGIEYTPTAQISLLAEIGLSPWEKLGDKVNNETIYKNMCWVNPYTFLSARYYFKPGKENGTGVRWYTAASYQGLYTAHKFLQFNGTGRYQAGLFAGIHVGFLKTCYFELELGPGYKYNSWDKSGFNLYGNGGLGFRF